MKLPQKLMDEFKDEVQGCKFLGYKLKDFSKEELMVCVAMMGRQLQDADRRHQHEMEFMSDIDKAKQTGVSIATSMLRDYGLVK